MVDMYVCSYTYVCVRVHLDMCIFIQDELSIKFRNIIFLSPHTVVNVFTYTKVCLIFCARLGSFLGDDAHFLMS